MTTPRFGRGTPKQRVVAGFTTPTVPAALPFDMFWPHGVLSRCEWTGYLCASDMLRRYGLRLSYADYGVHHPNAEMVDPRLVGRDLALVYATNESWLVFVSNAGEARGIRHIANQWRDHPYRRRADIYASSPCWADSQIELFCSTEITPYELKMWPQLATNRHLSVASRQVRASCSPSLLPCRAIAPHRKS